MQDMANSVNFIFLCPHQIVALYSSLVLCKGDLKLFFWVADFFLVPGRDKYTMWDRRPLGQILFDPNRLYDVLYVN